MDFFVRLALNTNATFISSGLHAQCDPGVEINKVCFQGNGCSSITEIEFSGGRAVFMGDPVFHGNDHSIIGREIEKGNIGDIIRRVDGFYYLLIFFEKEHRLIISSGMFSIMPVYYHLTENVLTVSSSFDLLADHACIAGIVFDTQYYLEKALFNYPLFDRTPLEGIKTLPSCSFIDYSGSSYSIKKHTFIQDYFTDKPEPWRKACDRLADLFIEEAIAFIPDEPVMASLTGGFDSRTIFGLALSLDKVSGTFSYGAPGDHDIEIAKSIAKSQNIMHLPIELDSMFASDHFPAEAARFITLSNGLGNISRAQYNYIAGTALRDTKYLLSGNFGSEILRSIKIPGVVTSAALFDIFITDTPSALKDRLLSYPALAYLNSDIIDKSIDNLVNEIMAYREMAPTTISLNQKFYIYIFEEVFRKYFGAEIVVESHYLKPRTPFLSFAFLKAVLKTELAGANGYFMEKNPLKRFQGQVLYAKIMQKVSPQLNKITLDRGYAPRDLLTLTGPLKIAAGYLNRKMSRKTSDTPDYLTASLASFTDHIRDTEVEMQLFSCEHAEKVIAGGWAQDQMNFNNMISAILYAAIIKNRF